jgi:hypothetical protein
MISEHTLPGTKVVCIIKPEEWVSGEPGLPPNLEYMGVYTVDHMELCPASVGVALCEIPDDFPYLYQRKCFKYAVLPCALNDCLDIMKIPDDLRVDAVKESLEDIALTAQEKSDKEKVRVQ